MRLRLKYVLPLAQMALTGWMVWYAGEWSKEVSARVHGMVGPGPTWDLALYINEPGFVLRIAWFHFINNYVWDCALFVAVIGLFWYWIALNIESFRNRRELFLFKSHPLRVSANLLLIALGIFLGLVNAANSPGGSFYSLPTRPWWTYLVLLFQVFWPVALVLFPGYDLIRSFRRDYLQRRELPHANISPLP